MLQSTIQAGDILIALTRAHTHTRIWQHRTPTMRSAFVLTSQYTPYTQGHAYLQQCDRLLRALDEHPGVVLCLLTSLQQLAGLRPLLGRANAQPCKDLHLRHTPGTQPT